MQEAAPNRQDELRKLEGANHSLVGEARLLLAIAATVVVLIRPSHIAPSLLPAVLFAYAVYAALSMTANSGQTGEARKRAYWIDAACYLLAAGLSGGFASDLFVFLLFPVVVASFQGGFRRGARVAATCAASFAGVGALDAWLDPAVDLHALSLWPIAVLLIAGLVLARWGNSEFTLMRRLAFLNDLNDLASPRFNFEHAMGRLAETLRAYHRADACVAVMRDPQSEGYLLCEVDGARRENSVRGERIDNEVAEPLLRALPDLGFIYGQRDRVWQRTVAVGYDRASLERRPSDPAALEELANLLEARSFITVPIYLRHRPIGRLYVISRRVRYVASDLRFLFQAVGHAALAIENIQLIDRLASEVATQERQRISRDLHDGTIQPYIGLKLALEALRHQVPADTPFAAEVDDLTRMANEGIAELRRYVAGLRGGDAGSYEESLLGAVHRQAQKFSEFHGIEVQVEADSDVRLKKAVFHEVMQIVREGLANIRRHTSARRALLGLRDKGDRLVVEFINEGGPDADAKRIFFPRSLNERAADLGGRVEVEHRDDGQTRVAVAIPL